MANSTGLMLKAMGTTSPLTEEETLVEQGHDAMDQQNDNDHPELTPTPKPAPTMVDILMHCLNPDKKPENSIK